jgi:hypothetical protein
MIRFDKISHLCRLEISGTLITWYFPLWRGALPPSHPNRFTFLYRLLGRVCSPLFLGYLPFLHSAYFFTFFFNSSLKYDRDFSWIPSWISLCSVSGLLQRDLRDLSKTSFFFLVILFWRWRPDARLSPIHSYALACYRIVVDTYLSLLPLSPTDGNNTRLSRQFTPPPATNFNHIHQALHPIYRGINLWCKYLCLESAF